MEQKKEGLSVGPLDLPMDPQMAVLMAAPTER